MQMEIHFIILVYLIAPAYMKLNVVLSILIPFSSELVKKMRCCPKKKKNELDEGVQGGDLKITILC